MSQARDSLIKDVQYVRQALLGLPDDEIQKALRQVLNTYAPFYSHADLEAILREAEKDLSNRKA